MKKTKSESLRERDTDINSVSIIDFSKATAQWNYVNDENFGMLDNVILPNHFNIPMIDLEELLAEMRRNTSDQAVSVRAFIGIEKYSEEHNTYEMKLYMTGVNAIGEPIYQQDDGESAIYDFISPCPPTC